MCFEIGENEDEFTGTVSFQPDEPSVYVADTAYVYFGWWLRKPGSGTDSMMIESFAGGTAPIGADALDPIGGKATYNGSAGGKYVVVEAGAPGDDTDNDAEVGHFDAAVTLDADFDPVDSGTEDLTITGTIDEFVLSPASYDAANPVDATDWVVTLTEGPSVHQ